MNQMEALCERAFLSETRSASLLVFAQDVVTRAHAVTTSGSSIGVRIRTTTSGGLPYLYFTSLNRPGGLGGFDVYAAPAATTTRHGGQASMSWSSMGRTVTPERPFGATASKSSWRRTQEVASAESEGRISGSRRGTTAGRWSTPVNLGPTVNTPYFAGAPALSFDGTTLCFSRTGPRFGGKRPGCDDTESPQGLTVECAWRRPARKAGAVDPGGPLVTFQT